jgi:acyl dehydratase
MHEPVTPVNVLDDVDPMRWIGRELGASRWIMVDQAMIDAFGRTTLDWDRMHVDPEWCREHSPYGVPIGFGFLSVSLLTVMLNEVLARPNDEVATLNYGFDRLRLISPVRVGSRVRGRFALKAMSARRPRRYQATYDCTVEIEGEDRPALVAEWLVVTDTAAARPALDRAAA